MAERDATVVALYDIHGNVPALDAVLAQLRDNPPDVVVVGGDVCAGPMPREVLARLRELPWPTRWLRGNADRAVVMGFDGTIGPELLDHPLYAGDAWAATFLDATERDFLAGLPPLQALEVDGLGEVLFCHGSARSDEERVTTATPEDRLARILRDAGARVLVGGHTHRQFDRRAGHRRMINAGSIGRPYEREPGAYWLRLGPDVSLQRTAYDTATADAAFHALGYPAADLIFAPVDPDVVAADFERASARPLAPASLIASAENPLYDRPA
ncbi:MAG: metallophosphoesterase family protein [Solirubrobacterales bacterium]|nr:metallophosphoesterase family protein [Solirubrobacterales bacterium]